MYRYIIFLCVFSISLISCPVKSNDSIFSLINNTNFSLIDSTNGKYIYLDSKNGKVITLYNNHIIDYVDLNLSGNETTKIKKRISGQKLFSSQNTLNIPNIRDLPPVLRGANPYVDIEESGEIRSSGVIRCTHNLSIRYFNQNMLYIFSIDTNDYHQEEKIKNHNINIILTDSSGFVLMEFTPQMSKLQDRSSREPGQRSYTGKLHGSIPITLDDYLEIESYEINSVD